MHFTASSWLPPLSDLPDVPICDFMLDEKYGRASIETSLDPYICGETGSRISAQEQVRNVDYLARALAQKLAWPINERHELEKVVAIFSLNVKEVPTVNWAVQRLNGVCAPISASYTAGEVAVLLEKSKAKAVFTVTPLLAVAQEAATKVGISRRNIFLLPMPGEKQAVGNFPELANFQSLLKTGESLPELEPIRWNAGDSARRTAFLCHSSGTSGQPKIVAVSHRNIIGNVVALTLFELSGRGGPNAREVVLGVLPSSHIYGLVIISSMSTYRGDSVIVLPKFDMQQMLQCVETFRISIFPVVPPIVVAMGKSPELLQKYDLGSIKTVLCGGAPLDDSTTQRLTDLYSHWSFRGAYGLTEIGACATMTSADDPWPGSAGVVIPGVTIKLMREDGTEINERDQSGEVFCHAPGVVQQYLNDAQATQETFVVDETGKRWLRTGDIALFKTGPRGTDHIFIVDRIKEVVKVKGLQVVPAELEAHLLEHPAVADCAVIGIPDERSGELPRAYVQLSPDSNSVSAQSVKKELERHVESQKARQKWLRGGIEFVEAIPRSPSGKILRRLLRDQYAKGLQAKL